MSYLIKFSAKIQDSRQKLLKLKIFMFKQNTLVLPFGSKIRSISYGFRDICDFSFSPKIQDDRQKLLKLKIFMFQQNTLFFYYPVGPKFPRNRSISDSFTDICHFSNSRWPPKVVKFEIFHIATKYSCTTLWVKNSLEIALSLTVSRYLHFFVFCKKTVKETPMAAILFLSRIIPKEALTMNISCKFGKCTLHAL